MPSSSSCSVQILLLRLISFDIIRKWKSWRERRPRSSFLWLCCQIQSSDLIKLPVFALSCWKKRQTCSCSRAGVQKIVPECVQHINTNLCSKKQTKRLLILVGTHSTPHLNFKNHVLDERGIFWRPVSLSSIIRIYISTGNERAPR